MNGRCAEDEVAVVENDVCAGYGCWRYASDCGLTIDQDYVESRWGYLNAAAVNSGDRWRSFQDWKN